MKSPLIVIMFFVLTVLYGCQKDEYFTLKGSCVGFVHLIDDRGMIVDDRSGVTFTVEGTGLSSVTGANGKFVIDNLEAGTYDLEYSSEEVGSYRLFSRHFVGGSEPAFMGMQQLYLKPDLEFASFEALLSGDRINIEGEFSEGKDYLINYFVSREPDVSYLNYEYSSGFGAFGNRATAISTGFYLGDTDYQSGETIYFTVYLDNLYADQYFYIDPATEQRYKPTMTKAWETIAFTIP